jgi:hypothetical protein
MKDSRFRTVFEKCKERPWFVGEKKKKNKKKPKQECPRRRKVREVYYYAKQRSRKTEPMLTSD